MVTSNSKTSRVLIIDDSHEAVAVLVVLLESAGYDVISVYDGRQALSMLRSHAFDLAILDNDMPNLGGIETLTELRDFLPDMPVIVCSGAVTERETTRYRELGITGLVPKPVETRALLTKVAEALEHRDPRGTGAAPTLLPTRNTAAPFAASFTSPLFTGTSLHADKLQEDFNRLRAFRSVAILEGAVGSGRFELALGLAPTANDHTLVCHSDELSLDQLNALLIPAAADGLPVFLIVLDAERLPPVRQSLLENLVRGRLEQHAALSKTLRVVLTSRTSLCDNLFDEFLLMRAVASTRQLPPFEDRRQDWPEIARSILGRVGTGRAAFAQTSLRWITDQPWPGNYMQLHRTIELARRRAGVESVIMVEHLEAALEAERTCDEPLFHDVLYHVHSGHD
jgi:DNA-binding NtrC family response regulator